MKYSNGTSTQCYAYPYLSLFPVLLLQVLLDLARGLFEETASLDAMMSQVMKEAQELIPCEHCTVVILDQEDKEVYIHTINGLV